MPAPCPALPPHRRCPRTALPWLLMPALLSAACSTRPPAEAASAASTAPARAASSPAPANPIGAFERRLSQQAERSEQEGDLARALLDRQALVLLRPEDQVQATRLAQLQQRIETQAAELWRQAETARQRGDQDRATELLLRTLLLQPRHVQAAQAMRQIEIERNRRGPLARPPKIEAAAALPRPSPRTSESRDTQLDKRNEQEHATLLRMQEEAASAARR